MTNHEIASWRNSWFAIFLAGLMVRIGQIGQAWVTCHVRTIILVKLLHCVVQHWQSKPYKKRRAQVSREHCMPRKTMEARAWVYVQFFMLSYRAFLVLYFSFPQALTLHLLPSPFYPYSHSPFMLDLHSFFRQKINTQIHEHSLVNIKQHFMDALAFIVLFAKSLG